MVDAEDRVLVENALQDLGQLARRLQVRAERLLDDDAVEPRALDQVRSLQLLGDRLVGRWWRGAVVDAVAADVPGVVELVHLSLQGLEVVELAEVDLHVEDAREERLQDLWVDGLGARELRDDVSRVLAESVVVEVVDRGADDREPGGQQALLGQVVDGRQQLARAEVAGGAEDDHDQGVPNPIVMKPLGEWIGVYSGSRLSSSPLAGEVAGRARRRGRESGMDHFFSVCTAWPPNWFLIIASILSANVSSIRLRNRANSECVMIGAGTDSSIAASTVQRPSPVSST